MQFLKLKCLVSKSYKLDIHRTYFSLRNCPWKFFSWERWCSVQDTYYLLPACQVITNILLLYRVLQYLTEFGKVFYLTTLSVADIMYRQRWMKEICL